MASNSAQPSGSFHIVAACLAAAALGGCGTGGAAIGGGGNVATSMGVTTGGNAAGGSGNVAGSSNVTGTVGVAGSNGMLGVAGAAGSNGVTGSSGSVGSGGSAVGTGGISGMAGASVGGAMSAGATNGGASDAGGTGGVGGSSGVAGSGGTAGSGGASGGAGGEANACPAATPLTGGQEYCSNVRGNANGGYGYELWAEGSGTGCMTVYGVDANFGASWTNVEDFLARVGLDFDQTRTHSQIGNISADFALTKTEEGGGLTYIGIYGWTTDPLREYYILDDWGAEKPAGVASDGTPRTFVDTIEVDGGTYDVYMKTRENKPAITGDSETFDQYFSIRQTARQCGHISVSEHFSKWEELGLPLGNLYEAKLLVEAQNNSGSVEFTTAAVVVE